MDVEADESMHDIEVDDGTSPNTPTLPVASPSVDNTTPEATPSTSDVGIPVKRKRGRPRKIKPTEETQPLQKDRPTSLPSTAGI